MKKFAKTTRYVYSSAAMRLRKRKESMKLTDYKILGYENANAYTERGIFDDNFDVKIINLIMNNNRTKNNEYLITPKYVAPLIQSLKLKDEAELFWGSVENYDTYVREVFFELMLDILEQGGENADIVNKVLIDYVPFAKISAQIKYIGFDFDPFNTPIPFVAIDRESALKEFSEAQEKAILRFSEQTHMTKYFLEFFNERKQKKEEEEKGEFMGFYKLDKRLDKFVKNALMPFLKNNIADGSSLGYRVYSIIKEDMGNLQDVESDNEYKSSAERESLYYQTIEALAKASDDYIKRIEKIQIRFDKLLQEERLLQEEERLLLEESEQ